MTENFQNQTACTKKKEQFNYVAYSVMAKTQQKLMKNAGINTILTQDNKLLTLLVGYEAM